MAVRRHHGTAQEVRRIGQCQLRFALKLCRNALQRQLCGHLAFGMPAHAICQQEQGRFPGVAIAHAVFIDGTPPTATELKYGKFHEALARAASCAACALLVSPIRLSSCRRTFSATLSGV